MQQIAEAYTTAPVRPSASGPLHINYISECYNWVRRGRCEACGVRKVSVPWARESSGFTLLLEALVMAMVPVILRKAAEHLINYT